METKKHEKVIQAVKNGDFEMVKELEGERWNGYTIKAKETNHLGKMQFISFVDDDPYTSSRDITITTGEEKILSMMNLVGMGFITEERYKQETGRDFPHDPNEGRKGYFMCWECGRWQPEYLRESDGTCEC